MYFISISLYRGVHRIVFYGFNVTATFIFPPAPGNSSFQNDIRPCEKSELSEALFIWMQLGNMPIKACQPLYDIYLPV